jgi:hypothetical protein
VANQLKNEDPKFQFYELPVIKKMNMFIRMFINNGMRSGIPDDDIREATVTLYLDKEKFKETLNIDTEKNIVVLLYDKTGKEIWRTTGKSSPESIASLQKSYDEWGKEFHDQ